MTPDAIERQRTATEAELTDRLGKLSASKRERLRAALATYGSAAAIPDSFWDSWAREARDESAASLLALLTLTYRRESRYLTDELPSEARQAIQADARGPAIGTAASDAEVLDAARPAADQLAAEVAVRVADGARNRLIDRIDARAAELNALPAQEAALAINDEIEAATSDTSVEAPAIDTTTRGISAAQSSARGDYERKTGLQIDVAWMTEGDSSVCPICRPLHRRPSIEWVDRFSQGPPAHPRCRCRLVQFFRGRGVPSF